MRRRRFADMISRSEIRIPVIFVLAASAWIILSDGVVTMFIPDPQQQQQFQTWKGLLFVSILTVLLYVLIRRSTRNDRERLLQIEALHHIQRSVFSAMRRCFIAVDEQWKVTMCNGETMRLLDVEHEADVIGMKIWGLLPMPMVHVLRNLAEDAARSEGARDCEFQTSDGMWWSVQFMSFPEGLGILLDDVTEHKTAAMREEELIRQREESLKELQLHIERLPIGYIVTDEKFRFKYLNPAAETIFGYRSDEIKGCDPYGRIIPESARDFVEGKRAGWIRGDTEAHGTNMNISRDRGVIYCHWFNTPIFSGNGDFQYLISMVQDVTERFLADEALRQSEERYRTLVEFANEGILTLENGVFVSCNQKAADMLTSSIGDILGKTPEQLSPELQPDGKSSAELVAFNTGRALKGEPLVFEWRHLRQDGGTVDIEVSLGRVMHGSNPRLLCFWRDITDRKRANLELLESRRQLRALAARLDEVREEERKQLSRELHDGLGQTLTALKIDISLMKRLLTASDAGDEQIETIDSMNTMVDNTLQLTRTLARSLRPALLEEVGLPQALDTLLKETCGKAGLSCTLVAGDLPTLLKPQVSLALYRITQEALTNVIRHANAEHVTLALESINGALRLSVSDDGIGMESSTAGRNTTLGIVGMRERAEQIGGHLTIITGVRSGCIVQVSLPLQHMGTGRQDE
jgi:PAS domain S-box-containing protein